MFIFMEKNNQRKGISLKFVMVLTVIFAIVLSAGLIISSTILSNRYEDVHRSLDNLVEWKDSAKDVEDASDYLTEQARSYAVMGNDIYLENYFTEANVTKRRDNALNKIKESLSDTDAYTHLQTAINQSFALMEKEYHSMRLVVAYKGSDINNYPTVIQDYQLTAQELALSQDEQKQKAIDLVYDDEYYAAKTIIKDGVKNAIDELNKIVEGKVERASKGLKAAMIFQQILISIYVISLVALTISMYLFLILPIRRSVACISDGDKVQVRGVREYRYLAEAFNTTKEASEEYEQKLIFLAEHDILTGIYNRTGYDRICRENDMSKIAYKLVDIDNFKGINDQYGHEIGDKILIKVSKALLFYAREQDYICRIGGDEFVILLTNTEENDAQEIIERAGRVNSLLTSQSNDGLPKVTLSIGIAFGQEGDTRDTLYRKADKALYETKRTGRGHLTIYSDDLK